MPRGVYTKSIEHRKHLSKALTGKVVSDQAKKNMSLGSKGKGLGNQHGFKKGVAPYNKGKMASQETRDRLSISHKKYFDKIGRADVKRYHHVKDRVYLEWRTNVFKRDGFTCQICNQVGGVLNAHHPKTWSEYPKLRYDIDNGVTLCVGCHKNLHRKNKL